MNFGARQRPFDDLHDVISGDEAEQHRDRERDQALDEHPAEIFEMFEERFDRAAFGLVGAFRFVVAGHAQNTPSDFGRIGNLGNS